MGDQIKAKEAGGACGTCGTKQRCVQGFGGTPEGNNPL